MVDTTSALGLLPLQSIQLPWHWELTLTELISSGDMDIVGVPGVAAEAELQQRSLLCCIMCRVVGLQGTGVCHETCATCPAGTWTLWECRAWQRRPSCWQP